MSQLLAPSVSAIFVALALWHFYMAFAPASGQGGAVPVENDKPLFLPSTRATLAVGAVLLMFAALVAATADELPIALPRGLLVGLSYALAAGLAARSVGEFRYVGFFKRVRGSRFAVLDTYFYSPLCLLLAAGVALVAHQSHS
ncbi:MAG: DUF3995 domain-containing protein [Pseudomonadota bacterium]